MNTAKIKELEAVAIQKGRKYNAEIERLKAAGVNSNGRYQATKELKAEYDAACAAHAAFAKGQIKKELDKIIAADRPAREEAARARSAWKMAKYKAAQSV